MINGTPEIHRFAVDLDVHLIEVPASVAEALHAANPLSANVTCKQRTEPVSPKPYLFIANIDAALEKQIFYVPQADWEADVHHHQEADHLW